MRRTLFVRLPDQPSAPAEWRAVGASGEFEGELGRGPLEEAARWAEGRRVVLLVPTADVVLTHAKVPTGNRQRLLKAVPFALEDQLADEVDELHFAIGSGQQDGVPVAIVARSTLDRWLGMVQEAGFRPNVITPDALALPREPGEWTALLGEDQVVVRTGPQTGLAGDRTNFPILLGLAMTEAGDRLPTRLTLLDCAGGLDDALDWHEAVGKDCSIFRERCDGGALTVLAGSFKESEVINLLQGAYSQREQLSKQWRPWRPAAALLLVLLGIQVVGTSVEYFRLKNESARLATEIEQIYRSSFPESRRVVNAKAQMMQGLSTLRGTQGAGPSGFLDLLGRTADSLHGPAVVQLNGLNYRNGQLDVELNVRDLQSLDRLKQQLESQGLKVDIRSATAQGGSVASRMSITGAAS